MSKDLSGKELPQGITQLKDGRYMGRFTYAGKRYTLYNKKNPKQLKKEMEDMRYELEHGIYNDCKKITLDKWFQECIEHFKRPVLKEATISNYNSFYRLYIQDSLGKLYINELRPIHIQKLCNKLAEKGLGTNTIKKTTNILHAILKEAVKNDLMIKNPCDFITVPKTKERERRVLTAAEQSIFLNHVANSKHWKEYEALFITAFYTGMRIGEILALSWADIDFKNRNINVNKTIQYIQDTETKKCKFVVQTPKTAKSNRKIPMLDNVYEALKKHRQEQRKNIIMLGDMWAKYDNKDLTNLVFTTSFGNPYMEININRAITRIVNDINQQEEKRAAEEGRSYTPLKNFSPHAMRHTFATRCFECGISPKMVQEFLGHSQLSVTMDIYTHVTEEGKHEEIKKIQGII